MDINFDVITILQHVGTLSLSSKVDDNIYHNKRVLQENQRSKRLLGRPRLRWKNGIKKDFLNAKGVDYGGLNMKEAAEN